MAGPPPARYHRKPSISGAYPKDNQPSGRRTLRYVVIIAIIFFSAVFFLSPSAPEVPDISLWHHTPTHKPPVQDNSTSGEVRWYNDLRWLNPFSASVTLDEEHSVLPPMKKRPPIYAFYDSDAEKDERTRVAENKLLLIWRRAWWAQGFRPVVLGRSEAMNNPLYEQFQKETLQPALEADLVRWLAWGQMGTGILANWLVLPMGRHDDPLLSGLREGDYEKLTRYEELGAGFYSGEKGAINAAIKEVLASKDLKEAKSLQDTLQNGTFKVQPKPSAIAFYDANTNAKHYKPLSLTLTDNKAEGLRSLATLITSHLHLTFLNAFPDGLAILTPHSDKSRVLTKHAHALAQALQSCPKSPIPASCPPNAPQCRPCSSVNISTIKSSEYYTNTSSAYTIGSIPHPYTLASLLAKTKDITTRHIRRDTERDRWLGAVTEKTLGKEIAGQARIVNFKETVAGDPGCARGLWITNDPPPAHKDIEYHFGFTLPPLNVTDASPLPLPPPTADTNPTDSPPKDTKASVQSLKSQEELIAAAKVIVNEKRKKKGKSGVKEMVEAWNLADTEAWRFVRAFGARERMERVQWETEERRFAGGDEGSEGRGWRWFDR